MATTSNRGRWSVIGLVAAVVTGVIVAGVVWPRSSTNNGLPSSNPLNFYTTATISPIEHQLATVEARADQVARTWIAKNGTSHDTGFEVFAVGQVGALPSAAVQQRELGALRSLAQRRTQTGIVAAAYFEAHGKKDVWQTYGDAYDALPDNGHNNAHDLIDSAYGLGAAVSDTAKNTYMRLAPYEVDPALNGTIQRQVTQQKYSFPSGHATLAAAEATVMARLEPQHTDEFRRLEAEIDYSRLYVAAHYPSDILRGAFLGRLVGDYTIADHPEWLP